MEDEREHFKICSICRTPIAFGTQYYGCSVSTCHRKGREMFFCSVPCWDAHLPEARHRDAWAELETAPTKQAWATSSSSASSSATADKPRRRVVTTGGLPETDGASAGTRTGEVDQTPLTDDDLPRDVLVVMSKLKAYIKARGGANTSDGVSDVISNEIRKLCDKALRSARQNERKTVLARDFEAAAAGTHADH